jgi:large repetitive protein
LIDAVDNDFETVTGGGLTLSVLGGDTLDGNPATTANVVVTPGVAPTAGLLMNANGTITVSPTTPAGVYVYPYTICSEADPLVCDSATATVRVGVVIQTIDNDFGTITAGAKTPSVLGNDTLNGNPTTLAFVSLAPGLSPRPGITMNPDGTITVASYVPTGTYTYPYTVCSLVDPTVCSSSSAVLKVAPVAGGKLPTTGGSSVGILRPALWLMLLGAGLVVFARRRHHRQRRAVI